MKRDRSLQGPLAGIKVVEFAGIGPAPFAGMLLADMGADVVRIDRPVARDVDATEISSRGKRSVALDLKNATERDNALRLCEVADIAIEGFRPGVMEGLGLGPEVVLKRNPKLIYGRMTGWGQYGPLAHAAGHDLNYIAITGALASFGEAGGRPVPPLNLVGDLGGGAMYLIMGILAALLERQRSGTGQVIDCAMTDGTSSLMAMVYARRAQGRWNLERGSNFLDGGAHFYTTYECSDGKYISVAAIEPKFYAELRRLAGFEDNIFDNQLETKDWQTLSQRFAATFVQKSRTEWCAILEGTDACFAPVLDLDEAPNHPHNVARGTFVPIDGVLHPAPAPRFSRTPGAVQSLPPSVGEHNSIVLQEWLASPLP